MSSESTIHMMGAMPQSSGQMRRFALAVAALAVCFCVPLYRLFRFAMGNDFYSYIILMPAVGIYLLRLRKPTTGNSPPALGIGAIFFAAGLAASAVYFIWMRSIPGLKVEDYLSVNILSFYLCMLGVAGMTLDRDTYRASAFPLGMMIFMVPMPMFALDGMVTFLQYASAYAAHGFFWVTDSTFSRDGLVFMLPGTPGISVEPECCGIHSTWILLITSLLAAYLFLRSPWSRCILVAAVLPLGLLRNGFRIFTIGELCVHISPDMIDSPIHHQGGPYFFALSLIPLFFLLVWLRKREQRAQAKPVSPA